MTIGKNKAMTARVLIALVVALACDKRLIERAASDYYPLETGNWWRYADCSSSDPETVYVAVESLIVIANTECFPVTFAGEVRYLAKDHAAVSEYRAVVDYHDGETFTVAQGFVRRIALPLVAGSIDRDSICDSVDVAGELVRAKYVIESRVRDFEVDEVYGSVYRITLSTTEVITRPETTITRIGYREESYAPGIGLIRFKEAAEYAITGYHIQ